jgi:multiple sugar transport system substrate-binding protein
MGVKGRRTNVSTTRRRFVLGSTLGVAVGVVSACGENAPAGAGSSVPLKDRKPVQLEWWGDAPPATGTNQRMDQLAAWNQKFPNLSVKYGANAATGQGLEALEKFVAAMASGTAPNGLDFDRFQVATYANRKAFAPLDDYVKRDKYDMKRFVPATVDEAMGLDKKLYGIPRSTDCRLIYWNKDVFREAGLDPEKAPGTWDELRQAAIRLTKRNAAGFDRIGFHTEEGQSHFHIFAWQAGGSFQSQDGKRATLTLGPNQEGLEFMASTMKDIGTWETLKAYRDSWGKDAQQAFLIGQLGMVYQTNNFISTIARFRPDMKFGAAQPPSKKAGDKPMTWSGGFSFAIVRDSKDQDTTWEVVKFLASEDGFAAGFAGDEARAKGSGGVFVPPMSGQPEFDKKMFSKYKTGITDVDKVPEIAVSLMQYTRFRELSIAAQYLWDGVKKSQLEAISLAKSSTQTLAENNTVVQKALDDAWALAK